MRRGRLASDRPSQYSALARKTTLRGHAERDHDAVDEREVVARHDQRAGGRDVLPALDDRPPEGAEQRHDDESRQRIEHPEGSMGSRSVRRAPGGRRAGHRWDRLDRSASATSAAQPSASQHALSLSARPLWKPALPVIRHNGRRICGQWPRDDEGSPPNTAEGGTTRDPRRRHRRRASSTSTPPPSAGPAASPAAPAGRSSRSPMRTRPCRSSARCCGWPASAEPTPTASRGSTGWSTRFAPRSASSTASRCRVGRAAPRRARRPDRAGPEGLDRGGPLPGARGARRRRGRPRPHASRSAAGSRRSTGDGGSASRSYAGSATHRASRGST